MNTSEGHSVVALASNNSELELESRRYEALAAEWQSPSWLFIFPAIFLKPLFLQWILAPTLVAEARTETGSSTNRQVRSWLIITALFILGLLDDARRVQQALCSENLSPSSAPSAWIFESILSVASVLSTSSSVATCEIIVSLQEVCELSARWIRAISDEEEGDWPPLGEVGAEIFSLAFGNYGVLFLRMMQRYQQFVVYPLLALWLAGIILYMPVILPCYIIAANASAIGLGALYQASSRWQCFSSTLACSDSLATPNCSSGLPGLYDKNNSSSNNNTNKSNNNDNSTTTVTTSTNNNNNNSANNNNDDEGSHEEGETLLREESRQREDVSSSRYLVLLDALRKYPREELKQQLLRAKVLQKSDSTESQQAELDSFLRTGAQQTAWQRHFSSCVSTPAILQLLIPSVPLLYLRRSVSGGWWPSLKVAWEVRATLFACLQHEGLLEFADMLMSKVLVYLL